MYYSRRKRKGIQSDKSEWINRAKWSLKQWFQGRVHGAKSEEYKPWSTKELIFVCFTLTVTGDILQRYNCFTG